MPPRPLDVRMIWPERRRAAPIHFATGVVLAVLALPATAGAQGITCGRARSPVERAICASPHLLALDHQVAVAYTEALKRDPARRAALRQDLLTWLRARDAACTGVASLTACLDRQLTSRLAVLAPVSDPVDRTSPPGTVATAPAPPTGQPRLADAAPSAVRAPTTPVTATPVTPPPPDPPIPSGGPPPPAATVVPATLPAEPVAHATLTVTVPGRFTLAAHSRSGVALQLVDMLTGPSNVVGQADAADGRLDTLLDVGTYRLRVFAATGATDPVSLTVTPFHDAAPPRAAPGGGRTLAATLQDGEQRSFWLAVPDGRLPPIEAAGRSLADLRLWRNGRDLQPLQALVAEPQPVPGHPLHDLRLRGTVEPGTYLLVAYGGPPLAWTAGNDQPFLLRAGASDALAEGLAAGTIGPFGSERFRQPAFAGRFRLDLPTPADATLRVGSASATLGRTSRSPGTALQAPPSTTGTVEITGREGQPFTLRATEAPGPQVFSKPGTYWISAVTSNVGGDEVPPTLLLQRSAAADDSDRPPRIIASDVPRITAGTGWRRRFNLHGPTELLLQTTSGGDVTLHVDGLKLEHPASDGWFDVPAGYYGLRLQPADGAEGAIDVSVGGSGPVPLGLPLLADPVIPFGLQRLGDGEQLSLLSQTSPDSDTGLSARPVPVDLAAAPLFVSQDVGDAPLRIPVRLPPGSVLTARSLDGTPIDLAPDPDSISDQRIVFLPTVPASRTVVLSSHPALPPLPAAIPAPAAPATGTALTAGQPAPFDLRENQERSFALDLSAGGLYRIETLGRLHMRGRLATSFIPDLAHDHAGGAGGGMLIQGWLRAGAYRVAVAPVGSSGHGTIMVTPAPLRPGATLTPNGRVHASLPAGTGTVFPLLVTRAGRYRLEVLSEGRPPDARLDDADGWPITHAGPMTGLEQDLQPGSYRLLVSAAATPVVMAARLLPVTTDRTVTGHGPHLLAAGVPRHATWREPATPNARRTPDLWTFTLDGPAHTTINLDDGMDGTLTRPDGSHVHVAIQWRGELGPGSYRLETTSIGRNDRLDYTVSLSTAELQPGEERPIALPATLPFSLATDRVVNLSGWGTTAIKAVLSRDDGTELLCTGPRADDWSLGLSRRLSAGRYRLELSAAVPPGATDVPQDPGLRPPPPVDEVTAPYEPGNTASAAGSDDPDSGNGTDNAGDAGPAPDSDATAPDPSPDPSPDPGPATPAPAADDDAPAADDTDTTLTARLDLPPVLPTTPAPATATTLTGSGVHVLAVKQPKPGTLLVADAASAAAYVLSLERQHGSGWRTVAVSTGTAPRLAVPGDGDPAAWRLEAWPVDGGDTPLSLAARVLDDAGSALATVDGFPAALAVARRRLPDRTLLHVTTAPDGLLSAAWPGHPATPAGGQIAPQDDTLWLLAASPGPLTLSPVDPVPGTARSVTIPAGGSVTLPHSSPDSGHTRIWLAESGLGQPGLVGGPVSPGSALAPADTPVLLRNAGDSTELAAEVTLLDLAMPEPVKTTLPFHVQIPPRSALLVRLSDQPTRLRVVLPPGTAVLSSAASVWTGHAPTSRDLVGTSGPLTLVNTTDHPAPVSLLPAPADASGTLRPGTVFKRFFGAAGSLDLPVEAASGTRIAIAGDAILQWTGADGAVLRGTALSPPSATGRLLLRHGPGAVVLSMQAPGRSPWPMPAAAPLPADGHATLSGDAMAWQLHPSAPALLDVSTTAPVLLALGDAPPDLFPAGAELHRAIPAGATELRAYSPHDGPLAGTLALDLSPLRMLGNGVGPVTAVAPGGTALFGFTLPRPALIGVGVRSEPDLAQVRLLRADGTLIGAGVAQLHALPSGSYLLEAKVPADAAPTVLRPAVLGLDTPGNGPPPEIIRHYLELAGLKGPTP